MRAVAALVAKGDLDEPRDEAANDITTLLDLLDVWLAWQIGRADLSDHTKRNNKKQCAHLVRLIPRVRLADLTTHSLEEYQHERLREGAATRTVRNEISTVIQAWRWGRRRELAPERALERPKLKHRYVLTRYVPQTSEFWRVFDFIPDDRAWAKTMLILMEATGARPGEVADLCWDDIRWSGTDIRLFGKTGERWSSVHPDVIAYLRSLRPEGATGRVLPVKRNTAIVDLRNVLRLACAAAGVPYFQPKQIRHMVENRLFDSGLDPATVGAQLGHTPEVSLRHYRQVRQRHLHEGVLAAGLGVRPAQLTRTIDAVDSEAAETKE